MKIIKHTFTVPSLQVVNGELKEVGSKTETCTFTLLSKGIGLYEELADEPLMASLLKFNKDNEQDSVGQLLDKNFIKNLACASYVKIEGNAFHNNRKTCEEFKKKQFYEKINEDLDNNRILNKHSICALEEIIKIITKREKEQTTTSISFNNNKKFNVNFRINYKNDTLRNIKDL